MRLKAIIIRTERGIKCFAKTVLKCFNTIIPFILTFKSVIKPNDNRFDYYFIVGRESRRCSGRKGLNSYTYKAMNNRKRERKAKKEWLLMASVEEQK